MSTANIPAPTPRIRPRWIVSAWWDMAYIVITPLLIAPVVLVVSQRWLTAEQVSLAVIAFASLGHHLPGFMRAYGDRDLFARYRMRFLLAPVLVFGVALLFSPPSALKSALGLTWTHLHGLELVLLVWGTWHGLMQTFGFMRIYDVRLGVNDRWSARLDHWLCLSVFVAGFVFSDARMFGVANAMWQSGLPLFGPEALAWTRQIVGGVSACVLVGYLVNQIRMCRQGIPISWIKLLLIGTTGWFYWFAGRLSTNVLIGLAMFEIYHAVQYNAIVWIYNRRLFKSAGEKFGPLGFLFRDRWAMLGMYLAAIAAYSSIRYFADGSSGYIFSVGTQDAHQWLMAVFVTSSVLHFYFDGFIWKVSEKKTQQNLVDEVANTVVADRYVSAAKHVGKWAVLLGIVGWLLITEWQQPLNTAERSEEHLRALALLTPELPESQSLASRLALWQGDIEGAQEHAQKALALRPRSHAIWADVGLAYKQAGKYEKGKGALERAIELAPDEWIYHCDLGLLLAEQGQVERAEQELRHAVQLRPDLEAPRQNLAEFYLEQGRDEEAECEFAENVLRFPASVVSGLNHALLLSKQEKHDEASRLASHLVTAHPENWQVQLLLGKVLNASGNGELALPYLEQAAELNPILVKNNHQWNLQTGIAKMQSGHPGRAIGLLVQATRIEPEHFESHFRLGEACNAVGKYDQALDAYSRCQEMQPQHARLCAELGWLLDQQGRASTAESVYRSGLAAHPNSAKLHFNLGVLLWDQGRSEEAVKHFLLAERLGMALPAAVREVIAEQ